MFKKFAGLFFVVFLCCAAVSHKGADGFYFQKKEYERTSLQVNVVTYATQKDLQKAFGNKHDVFPSNIIAFSAINNKTGECTIHMVDPAKNYKPEDVGHELLHCVYGQFHGDNNSNGDPYKD